MNIEQKQFKSVTKTWTYAASAFKYPLANGERGPSEVLFLDKISTVYNTLETAVAEWLKETGWSDGENIGYAEKDGIVYITHSKKDVISVEQSETEHVAVFTEIDTTIEAKDVSLKDLTEILEKK